jgi:hypothetical protein
MPSRRRPDDLKRYLRRLPVAILASAAVWLAIRPVYNPLLCLAAQTVARVYENPRVARIVSDGDSVLIGRTDLRADSGWLKLSVAQITFNMIPFLALVLAFPGALSGRNWRKLAGALAVLAAVHVIGLLLKLTFFYAFSLGSWSSAHYSDLARNVIGGLRSFYDIPITFALPLLLWVWFFPKRVFELLGLSTEAKA